MQKICSIIAIILIQFNLISQVNYPAEIEKINNEITNLNNQEKELKTKLEDLKLNYWSNEINTWGLPELAPQDELVKHSLMSLVYSEKHEQAIWVAHIISPDVKYGSIGRSNDFRPDPSVKTGSCNDRDYFIRDTLADGNIKYDGFGFDRGHLAPSADFRWSAKALSESYYYSNMSPQLADFNRISWAKLEDMTRSYAERNQTPVMIVTGPLLREGLPRVDRAINHGFLRP